MARNSLRPQVIAPFYRRSETITLVGGEGMLRRLEAAKWLTARARGAGYVVFRREDVMAVIARIDAGELPPGLPKKLKGSPNDNSVPAGH